MIAFDFEYYKPATIVEAVRTYRRLKNRGLSPMFFNGGTEIITLARQEQLVTDAVIDIKAIPECNVLTSHNNYLLFGSSKTLNRVTESGLFPLLGETCRHVADHTSRNKITLGGNLAGEIIYREAVLPLLLADCRLVLVNERGPRVVPIQEMFQETLHLANGEFLVQMWVEQSIAAAPWFHVKRRKMEKIDYPLLTVAALKKNGAIRIAFSGLCGFPFRSTEIEGVLNAPTLAVDQKTEQALQLLPAPILDDIRGSADYRAFVLQQVLEDVLLYFEGV